jgi:glycosyltransferase involved in cell wall biosynthesis
MNKPVLSVLMPTYNGSVVIAETIKCILNQMTSFEFELVISDDGSTDETIAIAESFNDVRITISKNQVNLGYPGNLNRCLSLARGEFIFLFGQDDLLQVGSLQQVVEVFYQHPDVGAICRPYFAFDDDINKPTRYKKKITRQEDEVIILNMNSDVSDLHTAFKTLDQLSGLAFRRDSIKIPFHQDVFPCHVYPFAEILRMDKIAFIPTYTVAVRTWTSQCRSQSWIYDKSPVQSWIEMFHNVFPEPEYKAFRNYFTKNFCANNSVGLLQIRNYGTKPIKFFCREVKIMMINRPANLLDPVFIGVVAFCFVVPPFFSRRIVDFFKRRVSARTIPHMTFRSS